MRPAFATGMPPSSDFLLYAKQFGVKDVMVSNTDSLPRFRREVGHQGPGDDAP